MLSEVLIDASTLMIYKANMDKEKKRVPFTTTLDPGLIKRLKILAIELNKDVNDLIEDAMQEIVKKYEKVIKK